MEMECMIEFPHAYMDRRPRTRPRLGWDVAPQALKLKGSLAHGVWITAIGWALFAFDASDPQLLLATGSSDGRYLFGEGLCGWVGDQKIKGIRYNDGYYQLT